MSFDSKIIPRRSTKAPKKSRRPSGLVRWLRTMAAVHRARRQLRRLVAPPRSRGSPPMSAHLMRDLGLTPYEAGRHFWDHE
jgi:uncharacterized protein YjiS (DUF1127 family)